MAQAVDLEAGSENLHIRKKIIISHLPSLPQDLLDVSGNSQLDRVRRLHLSWTTGCRDSFGIIFQILHFQSRKCATSVSSRQAQGPTLLPQREPLLP